MRNLTNFLQEALKSPKEQMIEKLSRNPYCAHEFGTSSDSGLTKYLKSIGATDLEVYNSTIDSTPRYNYDKNGSIFEWIAKNAGDRMVFLLARDNSETKTRDELNDNRIGTHTIEIVTKYTNTFYILDNAYLLCCYNESKSDNAGKGSYNDVVKLSIYKLKAKYTK